MTEQSPAEAIFFAALEKGSSTKRVAYLNSACGEDRELRKRVERLLSAHPQVGSFLEVAAASEETGYYSEPGGVAGTVIAGRYKLIEQIGEGGMGTVWMAQQTEPVKRMVAVKLIKAGMDSKSVLARFEAERQALALMDHPNIAKVLDAGATDDGRPFFVMELVKGVSITRYCDERKLPLKKRLELFISICHAVQHAHQKGVIHRDLKPSNVLVAQYDDQPVPKVIDFGIAKAAGQPLTDRTLVTGFGAIEGTPEYMSPEQAQLNQLDIDTRSDIYSMGVLLYELLTSSTPVTRHELEKAGLLEVLRIIREQEPPRPSTRLNSSATLPEIAASRGSDPGALAGLIRNDLDWIVMKSLEKDRNRRYETVNGFADDIQRYLDGDAVNAHPPSTAYRFKKFFRRHRVGIATASAFVGMLIASIGVTGAFAVNARRARNEAVQNATKADLNAALYKQASREATIGRVDAELRTIGFQIDHDISQREEHGPVAFLHLTKPLNLGEGKVNLETLPAELKSRLRSYRQFIAAFALSQYGLLPTLRHPEGPITFHKLSPDGKSIITRGDEGIARLWDTRSATMITELRQGSEQVVNCGFSPDGKTLFTSDHDSVVRLWDVETGKVTRKMTPLAETRNEYPANSTLREVMAWWDIRNPVQLGNRRVLLTPKVVKRVGEGYRIEDLGTVQLLDSKTGSVLARLDTSGKPLHDSTFAFEGKWITAIEADRDLVVFSAEDGRQIGRLVHPSGIGGVAVSPSGKRIATTTSIPGLNPEGATELRFWDTASWKLERERVFEHPVFPETFVGEEVIARRGDPEVTGVEWDLRRDDWQLTVRSIYPPRPIDQLIHTSAGTLIDLATGKPLLPPMGKSFHPALARFAWDGRFIVESNSSAFSLIDTETEKIFTMGQTDFMGNTHQFAHLHGFGTIIAYREWDRSGINLRICPSVSRLDIPPDMLELWAEVAERGQISDSGSFAPWDEPTWSKKQKQLAAIPAPYADFPFPGAIATDPLYWLREQWQATTEEAKKHELGRELLRRSEAIGNTGEAARWRLWLEQLDAKRKEKAKPKS